MAQYKALKKSFIGNHIREEGAIFEHEFPEGARLGENIVEVDEDGNEKTMTTKIKKAVAARKAAKDDESEFA